MSVLSQGIHDGVPMDDYILDRISPEPSVSTGVIDALVNRSPMHAWHGHPRGGGGSDDPTTRSDIGQAVHSLALGGPPIAYIEADDWRTKDAKASRDAARAVGRIPMLLRFETDIEAAADVARSRLRDLGAVKMEQTLLWREKNGVWCRGRADALDGGSYDIDVKTCENADPDSWIRSTLVQGGYDIQAGLRSRGHFAITERNRDVLFLLVEIKPPYASSVVALDPAFQDLAARKVQRGIDLWAECMRANRWPGYDTRIHYAEPPVWAESTFASRSAA